MSDTHINRYERRSIEIRPQLKYNTRSELIQAELGTKHYAYSYDNIGNRKTAQELAEESTYEANQLNQYTEITEGETPFTPTFDADGNQTLIKTSTGIWTVAYNADKRPISFTQAQGDQSTIIECNYDYMGRRYTKKVTSNGTVSLHQRYIYRGYLQIACVDLRRSEHPALWYITWDPTEPIATRPLAIQKNATWYTYSHDLTKNVTELYQSDGLIASTYDYSPYGAATAEGIDQPLQWSSEYHDPELALTYYNYRHYNPTDGRWINREPIGENGGVNLYTFVHNIPILETDYFGLYTTSLHTAIPAWIAEGYTMAEIAALIGLSLAEIEALVKPQPPKGDFCKALEKAVQKAKKEASKLGNCKDVTLSCDDILERIAVWEELLNARNFLHKKCFDGGDDGHQRQTKQHKETLDKCLENYRKKCNDLACHEQK